MEVLHQVLSVTDQVSVTGGTEVGETQRAVNWSPTWGSKYSRHRGRSTGPQPGGLSIEEEETKYLKS